MHYPNQHLIELWALAKDDRVGQLAFQHLNTLDVSCLQKGQARLTTYKRQATNMRGFYFCNLPLPAA